MKKKKYKEVLWFVINKESLEKESSFSDKQMAKERLEWLGTHARMMYRICKVEVREI